MFTRLQQVADVAGASSQKCFSFLATSHTVVQYTQSELTASQFFRWRVHIYFSVLDPFK